MIISNQSAVQKLLIGWTRHFLTHAKPIRLAIYSTLGSITVGALPIIEQALIGRRQLRGRVTSEGAFCDIFAPVSITQPYQHRL